MQSNQQERLRKLIESSAILTAAEKTEWLGMLVIMNDKQAADLELILKTENNSVPKPDKPATVTPVAPGPGSVPANLPLAQPAPVTAAPSVPPLPHISNLPTGLVSEGNIGYKPKTIPAAVPANRPVKSVSQPVPAKPPIPRSFSPIRPLPQQPERNESKPAAAPIYSGAPSSPRPRSADITFAKPSETKTVPAEKSREATPAAQSQRLESIIDAGSLSVQSMRAMAPSDLLLRLQQLSKLEGYFSLLSYLEDSPLYKSYIATGKKMLSAQPQAQSDENTMTKTEFETFADILRKIQLN